MPDIPTLGVTLPGEQIVILVLQIVKLAMEGQTPEQRKVMWDQYIDFQRWWQKLWHIGEEGPRPPA